MKDTQQVRLAHTHGRTFGPGGNLYLNDIDDGGPLSLTGAPGRRSDRSCSGCRDLLLAISPSLLMEHFTPTVDGGGGVLRYDGMTTTALVAPGAGQSYWGVAHGGFLYVSNKDTGLLKQYTDAGVFVADITGGPGRGK